MAAKKIMGNEYIAGSQKIRCVVDDGLQKSAEKSKKTFS